MRDWELLTMCAYVCFVCATAYRLYTVVPRLVKFVDELTNWYVRMNRRRLKGEAGVEDCHSALNTLFSVLFTMTKVMVREVWMSVRVCFVSSSRLELPIYRRNSKA